MPADGQDAYLLGREEFVHRMERLIEQCQIPPIREALLIVDKRTSNNTTATNTTNTNTLTSGNTAGVPIYSNPQQTTTVLAPALSRSVYEVTTLR